MVIGRSQLPWGVHSHKLLHVSTFRMTVAVDKFILSVEDNAVATNEKKNWDCNESPAKSNVLPFMNRHIVDESHFSNISSPSSGSHIYQFPLFELLDRHSSLT